MKTSSMMIATEPVTRMPAWRSVSPMNLRIRPLKMPAMMRPQNARMSPKASRPLRAKAMGLPDRAQLGKRGEQRLGEHVVERADRDERDHDRLVDGAADARRSALGGQALVTADDRDDRAEQRRLEQRPRQLRGRRVGEVGVEDRAERRLVG